MMYVMYAGDMYVHDACDIVQVCKCMMYAMYMYMHDVFDVYVCACRM
jgi:hypothetical protein